MYVCRYGVCISVVVVICVGNVINARASVLAIAVGFQTNVGWLCCGTSFCWLRRVILTTCHVCIMYTHTRAHCKGDVDGAREDCRGGNVF